MTEQEKTSEALKGILEVSEKLSSGAIEKAMEESAAVLKDTQIAYQKINTIEADLKGIKKDVQEIKEAVMRISNGINTNSK